MPMAVGRREFAVTLSRRSVVLVRSVFRGVDCAGPIPIELIIKYLKVKHQLAFDVCLLQC